MFKSYEFTYAGMPASMFGMYIADMSSNKHSANSFGNKANLVETRLANRVAPIHYGVRYNDSPLSFTLIFGADHKLDRYEMQAVSKWLTGYQEYQWLSIDQPDMEHIQFRCLVQELTPIHLSWVPMAFEAKISATAHMDIVTICEDLSNQRGNSGAVLQRQYLHGKVAPRNVGHSCCRLYQFCSKEQDDRSRNAV